MRDGLVFTSWKQTRFSPTWGWSGDGRAVVTVFGILRFSENSAQTSGARGVWASASPRSRVWVLRWGEGTPWSACHQLHATGSEVGLGDSGGLEFRFRFFLEWGHFQVEANT
jgi:hypothetical protein